MWRLTVEVTTTKVIFEKPEEVKDEIVMHFPALGLALDYMTLTQHHVVGKLKFGLEYIEEEKEEGECEC